MTRRLSIAWPDARPFAGRDGRPIRILAVSDEPDRTLEHPANRDGIGPVDAIVGCGDLEPHWLAFLADAFCAPLLYVRGNHDRGGEWHERELRVPTPLLPGNRRHVAGIPLVALEWPGMREDGNQRHPWMAWGQVLAAIPRLLPAILRRVVGGTSGVLVISHAAPFGAGDGADLYHVGFAAYRWLLRRLRPPLWLHGHTTIASVETLRVDAGPTVLVNVTGAVLVELTPPPISA